MAADLNLASPIGKPWRFTGTTMRPNTLLLCKLLFLLVAMHDLPAKFRDPYLPFLPLLDVLRGVPGLLPALLTIAFWTAGVALLANFRVRTAAVVLGTTVILALLASKPLFQNHAFIVGCLFLLCGLHRPGEDPWLIRWQFAVLYFGALINKVLRADWWSGAFMHTWMHEALNNRLYEFGSAMLPAYWFAAAVSWLVMLAEFALFVAFLVRPWNRLAVWGVLVVHLSFLAIVGPGPFGYFTEDLMIGLLAFLAWPRDEQELCLRKRAWQWIQPAFFLANWDGQFRLRATLDEGENWLEVRDGARRYANFGALTRFLKYNPAFYVALFGVYVIAVRIW